MNPLTQFRKTPILLFLITFTLPCLAGSTQPSNNQLILQFVTGGDDLRGGNDNVNLSLLLHGQPPLPFENVNGGKRWPDHSSQTVRLPLPGTVRLEDIEGVRLETTFGGGVGGDNWNLDRLMVWARIGGVTRQLFDQPVLVRFTNDQRSRMFYFGQAAGRFDFNLDWSATDRDPNGFPLNPQWRWQRDHPGRVPSASICHYFTNNNEPEFGDCTNQTNLSMVDRPVDFDEFICSLATVKGFHGHLNWFVTTFTGTLSFGDHNFDDDYYLALGTDLNKDGKADGLACISGNGDRDTLHTEFNADETITHFQTRWWKSFRVAVDASYAAAGEIARCQTNPDAEGCPIDPVRLASLEEAIAKPKKMLTYNDKPSQAIMTGLFGVDFEHGGGKSELHPVYAMAANVKDDPTDNVWAMFVRNTGNEGYCSSRIWEADFQAYTFRLPWREGMNSVRVLWGPDESDFNGTAGTVGPAVLFAPGQGIDVTFTFPHPSVRPLLEGELHLQWQGQPPVAAPSPGRGRGRGAVAEVTGSVARIEHDEAGPVEEAIKRLPAAKRSVVDKARQITDTSPLKLSPLPRGAAAKNVEKLPTPRSGVRLGTKGENATRKLAQDAAQLRAVCEAWNGSPPGFPPDLCKKISR